MATDLGYMTSEEIAQSMETAQLELVYERALRQAERIYEEERARALRVQLLIQEYENDDLQEQIAGNDDDLVKLEGENEELRERLTEIEADCLQAQTDLKARAREIDHYKAEVNSLNESSSDATKLLSEKLALTRQLASLKPELEHLKSQAATQQNILAEKLALQRELSGLQVELETEKRAVQRMKTHEKSSNNDESALIAEVEDLKKELGKAQREAQKSERESRKKLAELEGEKDTLENKLDAFRNKLRSTKDQLKEAQDELEKVQAVKMAQSADFTKARLTGANPKKRNIARFDPDMTIGTPGNGGPAKKQRVSVNVGDKSAFSITPFLNRTLSILPESPSENDTEAQAKLDASINEQINAIAEEAEKETEEGKTKPKSVIKKTNTSKPKPSQPLKESTNSKANSVVPKQQLAKVTEEPTESPDKQNTENTETSETTTSTTADPMKKKQKVLNRRPNIFDEGDDAPAPKTKSLNLTALRATSMNIGRVNLTGFGKGRGKTLAEFSPLKKDRIGAMAGVGA